VVVLALLALPPALAQESELLRTIEVPLDHGSEESPAIELQFELGAPYDPQKPLVIVVADAQQFYVRRGAVAGLQRDTLGDTDGDFNVAGILGRGVSEPGIAAARDAEGKPVWSEAWRIFNSDQWIEDIDAVRRDLVGESGKILLFGASGGAFLVTQYLSKHGARVERAVTAAPVHPPLIGELGLNTDRFWQEIGAHDPALHDLVRQALEKHAADRDAVVMTLQRQNFFVPPERLDEERAALIHALAESDDERYAKAREEYQVDVVRAFFDSPEGIPIRVRMFELFQPSGALPKLGGDELYPDIENQYNFARPLVELCRSGAIPEPRFDSASLHRLDTEVFLIAGRYDHTVDYRAAIALASMIPRHQLFLAADDHLLGKLKGEGHYAALTHAFLLHGLASPELNAALAAAEPARWRE
jgi:pimeloyl-ACP methyl ester carboxylesterase